MSAATHQFYEIIAREFTRIESEKKLPLNKTEKICAAWEAYQRGEIAADECDRLIQEVVNPAAHWAGEA